MENRDFLAMILDRLPTRTLRQFKVAHVLVTSTGQYRNLDLDLEAPDYEGIERLVLARVEAMERNELLSAAPREAWERFWNAPMDRCIPMIECPKAKLCSLTFVIRRER